MQTTKLEPYFPGLSLLQLVIVGMWLLLMSCTLFQSHLSVEASPGDVTNETAHSVVDLQLGNQSPNEPATKMSVIRSHPIDFVPNFKKMEISFNIKVQADNSDVLIIPVLSLTDRATEMNLYLNAWGEFETMPRGELFAALSDEKELLECNLFYFPRVLRREYRHYQITVEEEALVTVNVDGNLIYRLIDRQILRNCRQNDRMHLKLEHLGFPANGTLKNLVIQFTGGSSVDVL